MGLGDSCIGYLLLGFILSPVILQGAGMFGSDWVPGKTCSTIEPVLDCCTIKKTNYSNYSRSSSPCDSPFGLGDLDGTAFSLSSGAFSILLLPFVFACFDIWCKSDDDDDDDIGGCGILGGFCFILYPFAGLLSFIGCMIIAAKFSGSSFGQSFKLCLASGLLVLAITGLLIFFICYKRRSKVKRQNTNAGAQIQTYPSGGAAAPYETGPPAGVHANSSTSEQTEVTYDPKTGGFKVFMKTINVFHLVTHNH